MCDITTKIMCAKESIILIDDLVDESTIELLEFTKQADAVVKIFSRNRLNVVKRNIKRRKSFRAGFYFYETNEFKDHYLLIDGKYLYLLTRPLKYNNKRRFYYVRIMGDQEITRIKERIAKSTTYSNLHCRHF